MNLQYAALRHNTPTSFDLNRTMTNNTLNSRDNSNTSMIKNVEHEQSRFAMEYASGTMPVVILVPRSQNLELGYGSNFKKTDSRKLEVRQVNKTNFSAFGSRANRGLAYFDA